MRYDEDSITVWAVFEGLKKYNYVNEYTMNAYPILLDQNQVCWKRSLIHNAVHAERWSYLTGSLVHLYLNVIKLLLVR